ncbi:putative non-specific serine/threonine protein kinase [Helianthus annuus]|nr:putative non-specific serine/threonine protein kinase [Helianthus annuus]
MLVGAYPFEDSRDPRNFRNTIGVRYVKETISLMLVQFCLIMKENNINHTCQCRQCRGESSERVRHACHLDSVPP